MCIMICVCIVYVYYDMCVYCTVYVQYVMCVYYIIGVGGCVTGWTGYRENVTRSETKIKMTRPHTILENLNSLDYN